MALSARHNWIAEKVSHSFSLELQDVKGFILGEKKRFDEFFDDPKKSPKLFIFNQERGKSDKKTLFFELGPDEKLTNKCCYFMKVSSKSIKLHNASDDSLVFGELTPNILEIYEGTISQVYYPLLTTQDQWGLLKEEKDRRVFLKETQKFADTLQKKIENLKGDLELKTPDKYLDIELKPAAYENAAKDPLKVNYFLSILEHWIKDITHYIQDDPSTVPMDSKNLSGPDIEIEYWIRRKLTLISVTEQLKSKTHRVVTGVLRSFVTFEEEENKLVEDGQISLNEHAKEILEKWREVDMSITDSLNEAKDNVKFLRNLHKVIEPLYSDSPQTISDCMPTLMNSMKMIHTLSRHYGTEIRMTNLFQRITNQMITRCKEYVYGGESPQKLWKHDPQKVIERMSDSIKVFDIFTKQYEETKEKLLSMPKGKQFNFDPIRIFQKSKLFSRRLEKLIDMFSSIEQFKALEKKRIDGMEKVINSFDNLINDFKMKGHDLLDYNNTAFERDFVEYTMHNSGLENAIQDFMGRSLTQISSIMKQLELLKKFKDVLHREALQEDLEHKYLAVFKLYGDDLHNIQQLYEKLKQDPPIPRNMTQIAGNINWSRQLLRRITNPMQMFQENPKVFHPKESKKIVKHYNKLTRTLLEFGALWFQAWTKSCEQTKRGLRSPLIVLDPKDKKLHVNFDHNVLQLMKEASHLHLMDFKIPNAAKTVILLEDKLKSYIARISHTLDRYNNIMSQIRPEIKALLRPHIKDLENTILPAMTMMTWTSMNIELFLTNLLNVLGKFEYLVTQLNDIINNRIIVNLEFVSTLLLFDIPDDSVFSLRNFSSKQRKHIEECTEILKSKNVEVERAVIDLIEIVQSYEIDPSFEKTSEEVYNKVKLYYCKKFYEAIQAATKGSLNTLRNRTKSKLAGSRSPLFEVELHLQVPKVCFHPSLEEVQEAINSVATDVLSCSRRVEDWGIDDEGNFRPRKSFFEKLSSEKSLAVVFLALSSSMREITLVAEEHLSSFIAYDWLWNKEPEEEYSIFVSKQNCILDDFIQELHRFVAVEKEILDLPSSQRLGPLSLKTENLKLQFKHEIERWKFQFSEKLHQEVKRDMEDVTDEMKELRTKLEREVKDFASLKFVMDAQAELRQMQSSIDMRFSSIIDRYNTLEQYLPFGVMTKDEMDAKSVLKSEWQAILTLSEKVMRVVGSLQGGFKHDLIEKVKAFQSDVKTYNDEYVVSGPMVTGTTPEEAMTRLNKFKREHESLVRKFELYNGGEKLFGLPEMKYPDLVRIGKELRLLDQLYSLYQSVLTTVDQYKDIPWSEVVANINEMNDTIEGFRQRCVRLPSALHSWAAYGELKTTITNFIDILPLLTELSKPAMRERHWEQISEITGKDFDLKKFNELKLKSVLEANLLNFREDIEEITDAAEKQLGIEKKINEIIGIWDKSEFDFTTWKERGDVILSGSSINDIVEQLEESQASLIQMLTMRHVTPFRELATGWLKKLSEVNDVLDGWVKVQLLWMSLEAVFTGGDIARNLPQDTRVFMKVDKEWTTRMMSKAKEVKNVVECCQNEYIKNMLPTMFADLEKCQKALDGYLEAKRSKFPRFYFVSNPALLLILSQGSDKEAVQQCFSKIFDAIDRVEFKGNQIIKMKTLNAGFGSLMDSEDIPLTKPVAATGNIEDWLMDMLHEMERTIKDIVRAGATDCEALPLTEFLSRYCSQVSLLGIQFMWTSDVQEALMRVRHDKTAMNAAFKKQSGVLSELSAMTTQDIQTKMERTKIETLVTIQVHQRDVLEYLVTKFKKKELKDVYDFEWQKQLRCYWVPEIDDCVVKIADVDFNYCYEYLGCKERLVVTPLTDRCYISLSQAIGMYFGGAPAGPAGTGKTETVKDLGRALGKLVVVFNCSDQMHTADTAKIYKGLCQSGSWGCFDEFNRIDLEVLSVVAQQVMAILNAMRARVDTFNFPGDIVGDVTLDTKCGFFITMNPGYAGRQELPENLKALFRGVAMMVPDREIIIKVKLASVGYTEFYYLSKKFRVLYSLCEEQLSKQRHYDFGLRNILSVLRTAGLNLRLELSKDADQDRQNLEEMLMMRTLRDMNLSKLVADDVGLFISLLHDLFPNQKDPEKRRYDAEEEAMQRVVEKRGLIHHENWVNKAIQLYETSLVRHGLMMVGPAGGGKTTAVEVLLEALSEVQDKHVLVRMNPKAIKAEEMFGQNDVISGEWTHGVFSSIWFKYNDVKKPRTWIVCDGPVDAIWIENLNTVLDDNKLLTLANGDRIPMTDNVRLLFEVENLKNASPATVSRAGIVFVSETDLGYEPIAQSWLQHRREEERKIISALYDKYVRESGTLEWLQRNTENVMPMQFNHTITNFFILLEGLLKDSVSQQKVYGESVLEKMVLYALCWSLGALLESDDRMKFHDFLDQLAGDAMPECKNGDTLYEYHLDMKMLGETMGEDTNWVKWVAPEWTFPKKNFSFSTCLVPTVDSTRAEFLIDLVSTKLKKPVLVVGSSGTAKTSLVLQHTLHFDPTEMLLKKVNFSSATTPGMFQASIEADIEKRQGKTYAPAGGRWMTVFLDDVSMPEVNVWGDQPTLELVRQLIETSGFYFLEKDKRGDRMVIENSLYIGAMNHPGGGRNDIPMRLKRHFYTFNMTPPSQASIDNIYGSMLRGYFYGKAGLEDLTSKLTGSTIDLWTKVRGRLLPTPSKFHYMFNMRDLSRVFQGILHVPIQSISNQNVLIDLWKHECARVFSDRLTNEKDHGWFKDALLKVLSTWYGPEMGKREQEKKEEDYFVDFLRENVVDEETEEIIEEAPKIYEQAKSLSSLKERALNFLNMFNEETHTPMHLVLFKDALEHMMRISRIISMPRGNALLVGVGGSGRQSLTRLAAFIAGHQVFQIKLTRSYKMVDFLDDVRRLYVMVGKEGKKCTWIFTDFEIINENMLEYVNAILATGEVAGLFPKDERDMMCSDLRAPAKKEDPNFDDTPDNLYKYFINRIRDNLHIVLCFSPANSKFAERARRFPGLISGTTIDWFLRWPEEALKEVSGRFIEEDEKFKLDCEPKELKNVVSHIANVHNMVVEACEEYFQKFRKHVYVTPKSYLSYINSYKKTYHFKYSEVEKLQRNVKLGLDKLEKAELDVQKMQGVLEQQQKDLAVADKAASDMIEKLQVSAQEANRQKKVAEGIEKECNKEAAEIAAEKEAANKDLQAAMPFVYEAENAAKSVNKKDIAVIQKLGTPPDLIKRIMDCVLILNQKPLERVTMTEIKTGKNETQNFVADSYDNYAKKFMVDKDFTKTLLEFAGRKKDDINEETMELLEPYLTVHDFTADRARNVSSAAEGLCKWVKAMASYHEASKVVGPKLELLRVKSDLFDIAQEKLFKAQAESKQAQDTVDRLQEEYTKTLNEKTRLEKQAKATQDKMQAATNLIKSLAGEKVRWSEDEKTFATNKKRLVGDCALACAFVSYCGPFNHEFRKRLLETYFYHDAAVIQQLPVSKNLVLTRFLAEESTIAEWNSQGLPKDDLSIQNGILVTRASRYPILIDPQGQALSWLKKREELNFPIWGTTTLSNPKIRDQLEFCLEEGKPLLVEGVVSTLDPLFDPVLEKNVIKKGRSKYLVLGDKRVGFEQGFRLYLITKLSNPLFSPELSAKTTIIDFSVTQRGLEDQLLSRVIQKEQDSLEEQRQKLIAEVNMNTISLQTLDKQLLERLSASEGDLLEDVELINVLADTKAKAKEVQEKIEASVLTEQIINQKREQYRPVAMRGSVLYFTIVDTAGVNCMYQTSLAQFLGYFDYSLDNAPKANLVAKRVEHLISHLTYNVYEQVSRGLFEKDKLLFKLMMTVKIMLTEQPELLTTPMVNLLLRGGAGLSLDQLPKKTFDWLNENAWRNIVQVSNELDFFRDIRNSFSQEEPKWKKWFETEDPEDEEVPVIQERLDSHPCGPFLRLLLLRCMRDDRTRYATTKFIGKVLGEKYCEPIPTRLDKVWESSTYDVPIILLLTPGADPTSNIEELAKKKGVKIYDVSMGEGQEPYALKCITNGMSEGGWALLQNCHLGLGFMSGLDEVLRKAFEEGIGGGEEKQIDEKFRLWITCEPHNEFPINLLQMSIKVTNEPPQGLKAGLVRTYNTVVDEDRLQRVDSQEWRDLIYTMSFLHSVIQERRKYGPIGWCIPYEFNQSDLEASLTFLEKHMFATAQSGLSWETVRYMICEVQYGGRITDDFDRVLFNTFGEHWLCKDIMDEKFEFARPSGSFYYNLPRLEHLEEYKKYINEVPNYDNPEIFGLHSNADLTFGIQQAKYILDTFLDIQPKQSGDSGSGKTREEIVFEQADELLAQMPKGWNMEEVRGKIKKRSSAEIRAVTGEQNPGQVDGFSIPLNVFLFQEIVRLQNVIDNVRKTLNDLKQAINGEIIMTPELQNALNSVYDARPPRHWYMDASGSSIAWELPQLSTWFNGLIEREKQLDQWLCGTRPNSFWMTGFFNPQGFLTAMRQEVTRRHKEEKWALDDMVLVAKVTDFEESRKIKKAPEEGVYIHGLYLEGAAWDNNKKQLCESQSKEIHYPLNVLFVSATTNNKAKKMYENGNFYECPCYTRQKRTDLAYVFNVKLSSSINPSHWIRRGVALLCSKE